MTDASTDIEAIVTDVFGGHTDYHVSEFGHWLETSERFKSFVRANKIKIRRKIAQAQQDIDPEKVGDVRFELEIGYLLSKRPSTVGVEYEKYSEVQDGKREPSPDFTVTDQSGTAFNVEVKRIRISELQSRFSHWEQRIGQSISEIPSALAVTLNVDHFVRTKNASTELSEFLDRLETEENTILQFITSRIKENNDSLQLEEVVRHQVSGFEDEIELKLVKPERKKDPILTWYISGLFPVFYTQEEYRQFGDSICEVLIKRQARVGMINVLVVTTSSPAQHKSDLEDAIDRFYALTSSKERNDGFFKRKGFKGIADFLEQSRQLSGVLFRSTWGSTPDERNYLWGNPDAYCPISDDLRKSLQNLA